MGRVRTYDLSAGYILTFPCLGMPPVWGNSQGILLPSVLEGGLGLGGCHYLEKRGCPGSLV